MKKQHSKRAVSKRLPLPKASTIPRGLPAPICGVFADMILHERCKRRLSQYAVAKHAHVSKRMVGFIETRHSVPTLDMATRLLDVFGMHLEFVRG